MRRNHALLLSSLVLLALALTLSSLKTRCSTVAESDSKVTVHFIDVGQGDSILIDASGVEVLVDGGPTEAGNTVLSYLTALNVTHISLMVATHMHEDHIGGLITVLGSTVQVDSIIINNESDTTSTYAQFMTLAESHTVVAAKQGQVYSLTTTANLTVFNPVRPLEFTDQNDNSVVMKLQAGQTSFLLEGDAGSAAEQSILNAGLNLRSTVLKIGHHGSAYATTNAFLDKVQPAYAVISCGLNNSYGDPAPETMQRLLNHNVTTYGTYRSGTTIAVSTGTAVSFLDSPTPTAEFPTALIRSMLILATLSVTIALRKKRPSVLEAHG